jgi:hypothetical protein
MTWPGFKFLGRKGGLARAAKLSPQRRREIAIMGAATRWARAKMLDSAKQKSDKGKQGQ